MHIKPRILAVLAIFMTVVVTPAAFAEVKIAVVDVQNAILQSEEAKRLLGQIKEEFKTDQEALLRIRTEGTAMVERLTKDADVMSEAAKRKLQQEIESKNNDLVYQGKKLQRRIEERQGELFQGVDVKVQKAIEELVLSEDYDLILPRQAALYVGELYNITRKVTEKLNELDVGKR